MTETVGAAFARAVAAKDEAQVLELLHPRVDFRGMTPRQNWEAQNADDVLVTLRLWFEDEDVIEEIEQLETDQFADCERVGYRLRVRNKDGLHLVEQQAYLTERHGQINWLRIMCAGYRRI